VKLVINTNILFSFFRDNPVRELIVDSYFFGLELYTPKYAFTELRANKPDLMKYSGISKDKELEFTISALEFFVEVKPSEFFKEFESEAKQISPHSKDSPFFALALKLDSEIWSNEPRLKKQSRVKVYNTEELFRLLKKSKGKPKGSTEDKWLFSLLGTAISISSLKSLTSIHLVQKLLSKTSSPSKTSPASPCESER
jgi:predicted nucleic acid-binding protein